MTKQIKLYLEKNRLLESIVKKIYYSTFLKYKLYRKNKIFLDNAASVLSELKKVFKELNIEYWLDFGTLLGAYRNKDFLHHDNDIDIGVFLSDYDDKNQKTFEKYGFKKILDFTIDDGQYGREETYEYLGVHVDIFYYTYQKNGIAHYHDFITLEGKSRESTIDKLGGLIPREITLTMNGIEYIDFLGDEYPVPSPIEQHLSDRYGEDFMVENRSWNMETINHNIRILNDKIGKMIKY